MVTQKSGKGKFMRHIEKAPIVGLSQSMGAISYYSNGKLFSLHILITSRIICAFISYVGRTTISTIIHRYSGNGQGAVRGFVFSSTYSDSTTTTSCSDSSTSKEVVKFSERVDNPVF